MEMRGIDQVVERQPSFIDFLDYIPLISSLSGAIRIIVGVILSVVGFFALPSQIFGVVNRKSPLIVVEGISNLIRGVIAMKPVLGNIILYVYDHGKILKRDIRKAAGLDI